MFDKNKIEKIEKRIDKLEFEFNKRNCKKAEKPDKRFSSEDGEGIFESPKFLQCEKHQWKWISGGGCGWQYGKDRHDNYVCKRCGLKKRIQYSIEI